MASSSHGQVLPLVAVCLVALTLLWITLAQWGHWLVTCMRVQQAVDAAALSAATLRARGLNLIGWMNFGLLAPVRGIGVPRFCWWEVPNRHIGWGADVHWEGAQAQKAWVERLIDRQQRINAPYGGGLPAHRRGAWRVASPYGVTVRAVPPGVPSYTLRLQRNFGPLWYWGTAHTWWIDDNGIQHRETVPWPPAQQPAFRPSHAPRWYEQRPDFHKKRQVFLGTKGKIMAMAASRPYNLIGPMFPAPGRSQGVPDWGRFLTFLRRGEGWRAQLVP